MEEKAEVVETVDETLSAGSARLEASRRLIHDIDRRLSRGSRLLGRDREAEEPAPAE